MVGDGIETLALLHKDLVAGIHESMGLARAQLAVEQD